MHLEVRNIDETSDECDDSNKHCPHNHHNLEDVTNI